MDEKLRIGAGVGILFLVILIIFVLNPVVIVNPGEVGIIKTLGNASSKIQDQGAHLIMPGFQELVIFDIKTQKKQISTDVYTKDIQQAKIDCVLNYNLDKSGVYDVYTKVGYEYENKIITPTVEGIIKNVIGKWNAQDLVANREIATREIKEILQDSLKTENINVTNFQITDLNYSDVFEKAIENKVTAEQEALKAKNKTVQVQEEAKQKIIAAEAEAKSMAIRAKALTQNKSLVEYEAVQKWDGKLPEYMMGNSIPFINLNAKSKQK